MSEAHASRKPGWYAQCTSCDYESDLESLGWIREGAYSYGKRTRLECPTCGQRRWMRIIHLDENGLPDQSFAKVLSVVLLSQAAIWAVLLLVLYIVMVSTGIWKLPW